MTHLRLVTRVVAFMSWEGEKKCCKETGTQVHVWLTKCVCDHEVGKKNVGRDEVSEMNVNE